MRLSQLGPDYHVVIDKPLWLHREGCAALNIFHGDVRLFSVAFALDKQRDSLVAVIGGIQGRNLPGIQDEYHAMTKAAFGVRPRDLSIVTFKAFCRAIGVDSIQAVADDCRHHRSPFFGNKSEKLQRSINYDEAWLDRGGTRHGEFFLIPVKRTDRADEEIPARKRALYRKRYAMLDEIEADMIRGVRRARIAPQEVSDGRTPAPKVAPRTDG